MSNKPIFVATHPRACSTAFERVFMTRRNSLQCVHEPFGDAFYYGPERLGDRFENDEKARVESGFSESTFKSTLDRIAKEGSEGKRVFIKDITHYLIPPGGKPAQLAPSLQPIKRGVGTNGQADDHDSGIKTAATARDSGIIVPDKDGEIDSPPKSPPFPYDTPAEPNNPTVVPKEVLEQFHFTFLIRHPRSAIPSYYRCCIPPLVEKTGFDHFQPNEAGYDELRRFFDYCKNVGIIGPKICGREMDGESDADGKSGQVEICVIDADDLLDDPEGILRQYCESIGMQYRDEMLNWTDEDQEVAKAAFEKWNGFHEDAIHSKDLKPRKTKKIPKPDDELYAEWVEKYGEDAAKMIKQTVADCLPHFEYLKQFSIPFEEALPN